MERDCTIMEYIEGQPLAGPKVADEAVRLASKSLQPSKRLMPVGASCIAT